MCWPEIDLARKVRFWFSPAAGFLERRAHRWKGAGAVAVFD